MGHPTYTVDAADGQSAHKSDSDWTAPQLGKALLGTAPRIDAFKTTLEKSNKRVTLGADFKGDLKALLDHVKERISLGLGEPWLGKDGYDYRKDEGGGVPYDSVLDSSKFYDEPEEQWARALCEQFVFCMYHSPGQAYGLAGADTTFYQRFPSLSPIAVACQNLATFGILSRGVPFSEVSQPWSGGCSCSGGTVDYPAFDKTLAQRKPMAAASSVTVDPKASAAERAQQNKDRQADIKTLGLARKELSTPDFANVGKLLKLPITPGSVVIYNAGGYEYVSQDVSFPGSGIVGAHTASVLRVSGSRIQFIDTGVVVGTGEDNAGEGGTTDHSFLKATDNLPSATSLVSVGVLRDCSSTLAAFAKQTAASRPLGVVRLVVLRTASHEVVFVSKLLAMPCPVSKLIWSLRYLPADGVTVMWLVYVTGDKASTNALLAGAGSPPAGFLPPTATLKLANLITSNGDAVSVYRSHTFSSWRLNFGGADITDTSKIDSFGYTLDDSQSLLDWCKGSGNFGQQFTRPVTGQKGQIDDAATGSALVDS